MDRALKERTIGAVVLVAVAVLVVPVFLDGRSGDADIVTETVTLPGQNAQPRRQQTIVLERDREDPVPAPATAAVDTADPEPAPSTEEPAGDSTAAKVDPAAPVPAPGNAAEAPDVAETEPRSGTEPPRAAEEPAAAEASAATGLWAVQLGSFSRRQNAERLAADLRNAGYAAFLSRVATSSGEMHRVRVGPQKDRDAARSVAEALAKAGHQGRVVSHP